MSSPAVLTVNKIKKSFKDKDVVKGVSFEVRQGEIVGLLGPNGAGKTTCFYMVVGLLFPDVGSISLSDFDLTGMPMYQRASCGISYLPQNSSIFRKLTVEQNLLAIMEICKIPKSDRRQQCQVLLEKFQVTHIRNSLGASLSGGERRRVEIARSLISKPKFLLLDEPFAGIDPLTVSEIQGIISGLSKDGLGVLITDHNVRETLGTCDRAYVLANGNIIAKGTAEDISQNELVKKIYLGDNFRI